MSNGEEIRASSGGITSEQLKQYKELQAMFKEHRKTLAPRKEEIFNNVFESVDVTEVLDLIEIGGGESLTCSGEVEGQGFAISFRLKESK